MSVGPVLIVDDDADIRDSIAQVLEDLGFRTMAASNGKAALTQVREQSERPSLILLDLMMPVMNGWQFLEQRKQDPVVREIPTVVMTAVVNAPDASLGVDGHIRKPVSYEDLRALAERYCRG